MMWLVGSLVARSLRIESTRLRHSLLSIVVVLTFGCLSNLCSNRAHSAELKPVAAPPASPEDLQFFEKKVRPILVEKCQQCHGAAKQKGGLRLDSHKALLQGGESGQVVLPGKPGESLLVEAVQYTGDYKMPPAGKLPADEIAALTEWIRRGAAWPQETQPSGTTGAAKPAPFDLVGRQRRQWALQPVRRPELPPVARQDWAQTPIDQFILQRLEEAKLSPAPPADRTTLIRRVTFDLIGLPPTPQEISAFLNDREPGAFARVVDRLLASPHYGERWARHWLDLVRYAETYGHEFDYEIPYAFEYRDYVIRALNADVPYDQFVKEHIAGDLLPQPRRNPDPKNPFNESIIGTGFFFLGEAKHSPVDLRADQDERIDNQIDVLGKTFLGMTLGCARCHDHKFDAISTKDYYALAGYMQSSRYQVVSIDGPEVRAKLVKELDDIEFKKEIVDLREDLSRRLNQPNANLVKYLLAAVQVLRGNEPSPQSSRKELKERRDSNVSRIARDKQLSRDELDLWVACLQDAEATPGSLFAPWAEWAKQSRDPNRSFEAFRETLIRKNEETQKRVQALRAQAILFASADGEPNLSQWSKTGDGFRKKSTKLTSGAAPSRLRGTLRSQTFRIEKPWIHYLAAGKNSRIRLIVDGLQLIQNPLYGHFQISLNDKPNVGPTWRRQSVEKVLGHRAYIELVDDAGGWLDVDEIAFSDQADPPRQFEPDFSLLLERQTKNPQTQLMWAETCAKVIELGVWGMVLNKKDENDPGEILELPPSYEALNRRVRDWSSSVARNGWSVVNPEHRILKDLESLRKSLNSQQVAIASQIEYRRFALTIGDGSPVDEPIHLRGNYKFPGEVVPRRFLEALGGTRYPAPQVGSGRLDLARQIASSENPLTARVIVNRVWKQHFGEGLVRTPDDFGNMGRAPTHPELLDFLASEFVRDGWSLKKLHRKLLLSSTYQMSSRPDDARAEQLDPQNLLLHRMPIRRLEAEAIRDALLAVSGRLDRRMYGPAVAPYLTPFMEGRGRPAHTGPLDGEGRRTIYLAIRRNFLNPLLLAFDAPVPFATMGRRNVTNVPAQALALLNNPLVVQQAEEWAKRTIAAEDDPTARITAMYLAAFGRPPTPEEKAAALAFVTQNSNGTPANSQKAWTDLAHVLLNVKEFIFVN